MPRRAFDKRMTGEARAAECVDLTLPAAVPLAVLLPRVCELVDRMCGTAPAAPARRLCTPTAAALDVSKTLLQNGIRDGDALVLTAARELEPPRVRRDPAAELAHATPADATCWDARTAGLLSAPPTAVGSMTSGGSSRRMVAGKPLRVLKMPVKSSR